MDLTAFAEAVGTEGEVTIAGLGTRGGAVAGVRCVAAPAGVAWIQADEMIASCGAGTPVAELAAALAPHGQRVAMPGIGTVGGALATAHSGVRRLGDGPIRDVLLQARYVSAAGKVVQAGGPTVKNVSGFDLCRLLVGSHGAFGFLGDVIVRTRPIAAASQWYRVEAVDPWPVFARLHRPVSVLWDGVIVHALLEGHPLDLAEQAAACSMHPVDGPPPVPAHRRSIRHEELPIAASAGRFVAELGAGVVHTDEPLVLARDAAPDPVRAELVARLTAQFDPAGRMNPGVHVR